MRILPAVTLALFGAVSAAAQAGEPVQLTAEQMDRVSAGQLELPSFNLDLASFDWETGQGGTSFEVIGSAVSTALEVLRRPPTNNTD